MSGIAHADVAHGIKSNDYNRIGSASHEAGKPTNVNIMSNMSQLANRTSSRIFQVAAEEPESSELLVSSTYRVRGNPYSWSSNIGGPLFRPRVLRLRHAIMPMIPNINRQNHRVCIQMYQATNTLTPDSNPINVEFKMPTKYYYPDSFSDDFSNMLQEAIINQLPGQDYDKSHRITAVNEVDVAAALDYDTMRYSVTINVTNLSIIAEDNTPSSVVGSYILAWFFPQDCSFISRGRHFIDFPDAPTQRTQRYLPAIPLDPPYEVLPWVFPLTVSSQSPEGTINLGQGPLTSKLGPSFTYTRYITVNSVALSLYAYGESRVDRTGGGGGGGKVIGVIATSTYIDHHKEHFAGSMRVTTIDGPSIGVKNSQLKLNEMVDFTLEDEWGDPLDLSFPVDNDWGPTLAFVVTY